MSWFMWMWYVVSIGVTFYVLYQVNYGKQMTSREIMFFLLGVFTIGVPLVYMLYQQ